MARAAGCLAKSRLAMVTVSSALALAANSSSHEKLINRHASLFRDKFIDFFHVRASCVDDLSEQIWETQLVFASLTGVRSNHPNSEDAAHFASVGGLKTD